MSEIPIKAEIAGSIWKVLKAVGEKVAEDEVVMIMESMKMEIPISAPEKGVIKKILVKEGDVVSEGTIVAFLEV